MSNQENQKWIRKIDDDGVLTFPEEIMEITGWKEDDVLEWIDRQDGSFELRKINES